MLTVCAVKLFTAFALAFGFNSPVLASELRAVESGVDGAVTMYKLDESARPVVMSWNAEHPTALIVAVHGFGLHKRSFQQFAERMQERGITTYSIDVRGFGGWSKQKQDFAATFGDVDTVIAAIKQEHADLPIFLLGESMGGAIALDYAALHPERVSGVISSVPAYDRLAKFRTGVNLGASFILSAGQHVSLKKILVERIFHDTEFGEQWKRDPDYRLAVKFSELMQFSKFMKRAQRSASEIEKVPIMIVQGEKDRLMNPEASERLFNSLRTNDKQILELADKGHLIFEDGQFDQSVVNKVQMWLARHSGATMLSSALVE
jgi:acylglycerol lipase